MEEIYRDPDIFKVTLKKQFLERHGIQAVIMDEHIGGLYHGVGTMAPRLMVLKEDVEEALSLLSNLQKTS